MPLPIMISMQHIEIHACSVGPLEDLNAFVVALYDRPDESAVGLEIQKSIELDEQDSAMGMDTYCLVSSHGPTFYGGVESCVLRNERLTLKLSAEAACVLEVGGYEFHLMLGPKERQLLALGLAELFHGMPQEPGELILEA